MTTISETALRDVLLLKAAETGPPDDRWSDQDRADASRNALALPLRDPSDPIEYAAARAHAAAPLLLARNPPLGSAHRLLVWRRWVGPLVIAAAFLLGALSDVLSDYRQVNLLAPPLIGILVWNLLVYTFLVGKGLGALVGGNRDVNGPIGRSLARFAHGLPPLTRFEGRAKRYVESWVDATRPLTGARIAAILHGAATALAIGALLTLYVKGLAFEYLAGWESTFLDAAAVTSVLHVILTPASMLANLPLPGVEGIAAIAFHGPGTGENAARWIHLYAITITLAVVIPRLLLALIAAIRAHRLARALPIDFDEPYFDGLARMLRGESARVAVVPYSVRIADIASESLQQCLKTVYGRDTNVAIQAHVPFGGEDDYRYPTGAAGGVATMVAIVFPLTATPEAENHGTFVSALLRQLPGATQLLVLVDEAAFKARFTGQTDRLEQRRAAWRKALGSVGCHPVFVTLTLEANDGNTAALREALSRLKTDAQANTATAFAGHRGSVPRDLSTLTRNNADLA